MATTPLTKSSDPIASRVPFYYGWVMLPIATIAMISTAPGQTFGVSAFNASFTRHLQISQTQLATAYMFGTLLACAPQGWFGVWIDRIGNRRMMGLAAGALGAACFLTSFATPATIFVAFFFLRMFGQGLLSLTASNTVGMWFDRRLGAASALMCLGGAAGVAVIPACSLLLIESVGWRAAYRCLGVAVWVAVLPAVMVLYRNRPEDVGQTLDGPLPVGEDPPLSRSDLTLGEAVRTRAYWILIAMSVLWSMVGTAVMFHIQPLLSEHGVPRSDQGRFYTILAVSLGTMQFLGGFLADRIKLTYLFSASFFATATALIWLTQVQSMMGAAVFAVLFGLGQGLFFVLSQTAWPRYYGRLHLGRIRGSMWTAVVAASSIGPLISAAAADTLGGYDASLRLYIGLFVGMTIAALLATPPSRRTSETAGPKRTPS